METSHEQKLNTLYQAVAEYLLKTAQDRVPETGAFQKVSVRGRYEGTDCRGILSIEASYRSDAERYVTLGVYREGCDKQVSNYLFHGTRQEVFAWLASPEGLAQIVEAYQHLEAKAKNF